MDKVLSHQQKGISTGQELCPFFSSAYALISNESVNAEWTQTMTWLEHIEVPAY